jgi:hypothetical protein
MDIFKRLNVMESQSYNEMMDSTQSSKVHVQDSLFDSRSLEYRPNYAGRDIGELYKILFENDLNSTKQRTLE